MRIIHGDCIVELKKLPNDSIDSCITDPPAGISFMGKEWDHNKGGRDQWINWMQEVFSEVLRVLKPGGHGLVWAIPRTSHWTAMSLENSGFEIRDCIYHIFGQGFPKSFNVGKKINEYQGYGSSLKPAVECWWLIRKPFKGSIVDNVLEYGTGALNIDKSRIPTDDNKNYSPSTLGRFPSNLTHDGSDEVMREFEKYGHSKTNYSNTWKGKEGNSKGDTLGYKRGTYYERIDEGSVARFFYCSKTSTAERNLGTEKNNHPTIKPVKLMNYLVNLIMPPTGIVLDPFMGSGSTGIAALLNGYDFIGIEQEISYIDIARARIDKFEEYRKFLK